MVRPRNFIARAIHSETMLGAARLRRAGIYSLARILIGDAAAYRSHSFNRLP